MRSKGFTLIELMVVLVILGVLAAMIAPKIMDRPDEARIVAARQDIATVIQALKMYRVTKPAISPIPENWKSGGYLEKLPKDPWGHAYVYLNPGRHGDIDVISLGTDGESGGEGKDADIGSWML